MWLDKSRTVLLWTIRLAVGVLLMWSGLVKLRSPYAFLQAVYGYELTSARMSLLVAVVLPSVELFAGGCLLSGLFIRGAMAVTALLGGVFVVVIALAMSGGADIACGCLGAGSGGHVGGWALARAGAVVLAGLLGLVLTKREPGASHMSALTLAQQAK